MKLTVKYPIGRKSFFNSSPVLADGVVIGDIIANHKKGWGGSASEYSFHANQEGLRRGLPVAFMADSKREALEKIAASVNETTSSV